ncbi:alpha-2-macroglobulin domain protein [Fibrella aestuarina BUZ 2]|uniref:Alpha-2-macroglobulin domain protein n=1 Tax=Fibrella aestuarina BUZ 2 TaxID=1166018 RepID=I0K3D2_9BACT|nr:MG2 domain-containing protein [Fibrella aestuarina]CCG98635.1 alpha-2-macroglobulin domain protein [Fibrella aestuarina BUZ 2]
MRSPLFARLALLRPALLLLTTTLLLTQCARLSNTVQITGRNFDDEIQQSQNLTFSFNKNVGPENPTDVWETTPYIEFKPAVKGQFKWVSPSELLFSPAVAFDPATDYRAELTKAVLTRADSKDLSVSGDKVQFHTPYLQLTGTETWWTRQTDNGQPVAKTRLRFNYAVSGAEVAPKLSLKTGEQALTLGPLQGNADPLMGGGLVVTLPNAPRADNEQPLTLTVDKGLNVPNTAYTSKEIIEQTGTLPTPTRLEVVDVQTSYTRQQGVVRVVTTQTLQPGNLNQYYTIQPAIDTKAELTDNGLLIRGDFNETDTYVVTFTDAMRGVLGAKLTEPVARDVFFGKMPAGLQFANRTALYLSSKGARNVGLSITNVDKVQVKISRLYENNLLSYFKNGRYEEYAQQGDGEEAQWGPTGKYTYGNDEEGDLSSVLIDKTITTTDLPKVRGVSALNLSIPEGAAGSNPDRPLRGAYLVSVQSKDEAYVSATQLVSISDIGLITRKTDNELLVWANSIQTAAPLSNVEITLISSNNQSVYTLKTDSDGFVRFEKVAEKAPGFKIAMLTARTTSDANQGDFNFLYLADTQVETSRFEVDGKRSNPTGLNAFVYGDRNIYRPGETIHLNTVLRGELPKTDVDALPLTLRVLMPNGAEYRSFRQTTNAQGAVLTDVPIDPAAVTGSYTVEVLNANQTLLASQAISVEEFIPDRIKVDVKTDRESYSAGQTITLQTTAQNLFGPPASDRAYEVELQLKRKNFAPKGYEQYHFNVPIEGTGVPATFEKTLRQGRTNANGQATEAFPIPTEYRDIGLLEAKLFVTVFDENGRPVNRLRRLDIQTQPIFYGIRLADTYLTTNTPLAVDVVALTNEGRPQAAKAQVEVVRFDYQTVTEKQDNGQIKYSSKRREKIVYTNILSLGGAASAGTFRYVPTVSGEYEVRVRRPNAVGYTSAEFYAYGWGSTSASSFEVSTEGQVLMEFDKPSYETGSTVKVLFKAPFNGKLLVTVERNSVLEQHWLETKDKAAEWSFSVGDAHLPTAYVTATLIRAMDGTDLPLTVAHGFAPVTVTDPATQLPVTIEAVAKSFSKTKQTIRVKTKANAEVTVAVVDEGILQLKNFKTPNPHGFFFQKRALEVEAYDGYALLYPELSLRSRSSVGGDGYDLERRVNPLSNKRVQLVALWSGHLKTGSSGEAEYTIDIPQFSGTLRVMAVAYKDNAFGSAEQGITVSDPIVISAGVPRFLSPGDELNMPVNLSNTTSQAAGVTASVTVSGPLQVVADSAVRRGAGTAQSLTVQPGRESRTAFRIRATGGVGPGDITITVKAMGKTFVEKTDITVRPAAPLQRTTISGAVAGGRSATLSLTGDFVPGTTRNSLTISRSPVTQYAKTLSYLLGYPHGCTEQTISKAFPQLYFADLTKSVRQGTVYFVRTGDSDYNPATNIQQALQQIESRQLYNGGISLWPGFTLEDSWTTAYALHFMVEAQKAGYEVSAGVKSKIVDRLTTLTGTNRTVTQSVFAEDGTRTDRPVASYTNLYALYALALAEQPNRAAMSFYKEATNTLLTTDGRYLLATTYARLGDAQSSAALLPKQFTSTTSGRETGDSYSSPVRNMALVLSNLIDTDPDNLQIPTLARQLGGAVQQATYLNTQEAAFAFLALGKLARQTAGSTATATLTAAGKGLLGTFAGDDLTLRRLPTGKPLTLSAKGSGSVYYFGQSEGVPSQGIVADEDAGLVVRRTYLSRDGSPLSRFRQNDLIVVKLTLGSQNGLPVKNIVLTDLLPAGFEVENPRLTGDQSTGGAQSGSVRTLSWLKGAATVDHFDIRDDRVNYYLSLTGTETKTVYYMVRAVTKGRFVVGPVSADAMYNPELRSYNGAGRVTVE